MRRKNDISRKKAVFLDRDGVINKEVNYLKNIKDLRLLPNVARSIKKLNESGFFVIIATNQGVVARGWLTEKGVDKIHEVLLKRLRIKGARIDGIYYCPHHPNADFKKYKKDCTDRKPNIGLLKKAALDFNLSLKNSFLIGDTTTDIKAAENAGVRSILVKTGYKGQDGKFDVKPDFVAKNLLEAVNYILKNN